MPQRPTDQRSVGRFYYNAQNVYRDCEYGQNIIIVVLFKKLLRSFQLT